MCRSLIFDRVGDWDQRTVHSCAKHKLITLKTKNKFELLNDDDNGAYADVFLMSQNGGRQQALNIMTVPCDDIYFLLSILESKSLFIQRTSVFT